MSDDLSQYNTSSLFIDILDATLDHDFNSRHYFDNHHARGLSPWRSADRSSPRCSSHKGFKVAGQTRSFCQTARIKQNLLRQQVQPKEEIKSESKTLEISALLREQIKNRSFAFPFVCALNQNASVDKFGQKISESTLRPRKLSSKSQKKHLQCRNYKRNSQSLLQTKKNKYQLLNAKHNNQTSRQYPNVVKGPRVVNLPYKEQLIYQQSPPINFNRTLLLQRLQLKQIMQDVEQQELKPIKMAALKKRKSKFVSLLFPL